LNESVEDKGDCIGVEWSILNEYIKTVG